MISNFLKEILICPMEKSKNSNEATLNFDENGGSFNGVSYPFIENSILNLKLPFDQGETTSYDDILEGFQSSDRDPGPILKVNSLEPSHFEGRTVLLAGTGGGGDISWISQLNPSHLVCLDYGRHLTKIAARYKHVANIDFVVGDICDLPFRSESFDVIVSQGIIQHSRTPELAFSEKIRTLKPSGLLSIGNLYSDNGHNKRISFLREKFQLHRSDREKAKK